MEIYFHVSRNVSVNSCGISRFGKKCFAVPELDNADEVVMVIGMGIILSQSDFHFKFFTPFNLVGAEDVGHVAIEVIAFNLLVFLFDIGCFEYSWHGLFFIRTKVADYWFSGDVKVGSWQLAVGKD